MNPEVRKAVDELKKSDLVHSIIIFGSHIKGRASKQSDIDLCIIPMPQKEIGLKKRLKMMAKLPEKFDISVFNELPMNIRMRVLQEGKILYTKDEYYVYTLIKETDFEMPKYRKMMEEYHKSVIARAKA